mgnify:CR=1 FL=1
MKINYPVSLNQNHEVVDCYGDILIPDITRFRYRESGQENFDFAHRAKQTELGHWLVDLFNSTALPDTAISNGNGQKALEVKARNPWGRSGKPK